MREMRDNPFHGDVKFLCGLDALRRRVGATGVFCMNSTRSGELSASRRSNAVDRTPTDRPLPITDPYHCSPSTTIHTLATIAG